VQGPTMSAVMSQQFEFEAEFHPLSRQFSPDVVAEVPEGDRGVAGAGPHDERGDGLEKERHPQLL
jgi:hypothetical protein